MLERLFKFPVILVDVENEEKKEKEKALLALDSEEKEYDMIYGEAEYPCFDFVGIEDRWIPGRESMEKAMEGKFNASIVKFLNVVPLLVPWNKEKFKKKLKEFIDNLRAEAEKKKEEAAITPGMRIIQITPEQLQELFQNGAEDITDKPKDDE
jgi:hypothetical protein